MRKRILALALSLTLPLALFASAEADTGGAAAPLTYIDTETATERGEVPAVIREPSIAAFPDVAVSAWYADCVAEMAERGLVRGYADGSFRPDRAVSWGEALKLVLLAAGFPEQDAAEGEHWAGGYLAFAVEQGYLDDDAVETLDLDAAIRRDELADLCAAALELDTAEAHETSPFADTARESVLALYDAGILLGEFAEGGRYYFGEDALRRSELCAVLGRVLDYVDENFLFLYGYRVAIDYSLEMNEYDSAAFEVSDGRIHYDGTAETVRHGVDVSYYQGAIDWERVAADGIDFALIRCGYRGYGAGGLFEDERFRENVAGARAAGLDVGIYFFSQAVSVAEALEEADYTLSLIRDYDITFPVVYDWEQVLADGSRSAAPDWDVVTDCTVAFCEAVAAAGYTPMTYFNVTMAYLRLDMTRIDSYPGWLAWYHPAPEYLYDFQMWQYSSTGRVDGIDGDVDLDICFVEW